MPTSGIMISGLTGLPCLLDFARRLKDRAALHFRNLRIRDSKPAATMSEHRIEFVQLFHALEQFFLSLQFLAASRVLCLAARRLRPSIPRASAGTRASGGSSSRIVTGSPSIALKQTFEVGALERQAACSDASGVRLRCSTRIIFWTCGSRSSAKNMCSVRQSPMPSAPNFRATCGVARNVGIRADSQPANLVGHRHEVGETHRWRIRIDGGNLAFEDSSTGTAFERDPVAFVQVPCRRHVRIFFRSSIVIDSAPTTQHFPMPRATTAAWLVMPPREVRIPTATSIP